MDRLRAAADKVAAGRLDQQVPVDNHIPDLAVLGKSFNQMTGSLHQADQAKNAFIADVSHELRTPLTVLKGSIETLQDGAVNDLPARDEFLSSMGHETDRLIRLVNDLLVLTRADGGMLKLSLSPIDLGDLAQSRCLAHAIIARQRQVKLDVVTMSESGQSFVVLADADRLAQVMDNLLDNAMHYSHVGSSITIMTSRKMDNVWVQVRDAGPGIANEHIPFIFDRFYRVESSRDRSQGGSGLGLAIVRGLIRAHGGDVQATSTEGLGTTIAFWIPACPIASAAEN